VARQASSKMGGLFGIFLAIVVVGAIIGTPFYIGLLQDERSASHAKADADVQTVRRAVINLDESLARLQLAGSTTVDVGSDIKLEIPAEAKSKLQAATTALQQVEQRDRDRGTTIEEKQIAVGMPNAGNISAITQEVERTLSKAKAAINELRTHTGPSDIASNRATALLHYAEGRLEKGRGEYLQWQASRPLHRADQLVAYLRDYRTDRSINNAVASKAMSNDGIVAGLDERIRATEDQAVEIGTQMAGLQATIADFKQRIETLEATARGNRLQMADMQAQRQPIHGNNSSYAQLAAGAREAEAKAEALRFGTLQDAELVITGLDSIENVEYRGGTPTIGLLSLESMANNLREQLLVLDAEKKALTEQKQHYETLAAGSDAVAAQAAEEIEKVAGEIQELVNAAQAKQAEAGKAFDKSLESFQRALSMASKGAINVNSWKTALTVNDASPETPAAELNQMLQSDGDLEGTLRALAGDTAYQRAAVYSARMDLALRLQNLINEVAKLTESEISNEYSERIEMWRGQALTSLTDAERAYQQAEMQVKRGQTQADGKSIRGADSVWQIQFGQAAVHILRANLLTELANRQAEKDKAYELLKAATEGKEQSDLLTPAIDTIKQLQSNPS